MYFLTIGGFRTSALFHSCLHLRPRFWTSTFNFPAFCLFGIHSNSPPKLNGDSLWGAPYIFPRKNTEFWKGSKITLWKSYVPTLFWLINSLCVIPQWSKSPMCLQIGFAFLSWVWFLCMFPLPSRVFRSPWTLTQCKLMFDSCCCFFFFPPLTWVSWAKWILHNLSHALLQLLPLCSKNVFLIFDYFVTQAYRYVDILFTPVSH